MRCCGSQYDSDMPISLPDAFARLEAAWSPCIVGELNGQQIRIARLDGAFVWHQHHDADEAFLVHRGSFVMEWRDPGGDVQRDVVTEGDLIIVPRGVEHRPVADAPCDVILFEPAGVVNTGDAEDVRRADTLVRLPGARPDRA